MTQLKLFSILLLICFNCLASENPEEGCNAQSLENMNLSQLIFEVNKNVNCLNASREMFHQKYQSTIFTIKGPFVNDEKYSISEDKNRANAIIRSYSMFEKILKLFGDMVQYLAIHFESIDTLIGRKIVKLVNSNCVDSLMMLTLEDCKENVLDDLNSTFPAVVASAFSSSSWRRLVIREDTPTLNELFPKLNQLQIEYTRASDWKMIGDEFPNLTSIHVNLPKIKVAELPDETFVVNLTRKSPEIKQFSIKHSSLSLLKEIHDTLPKLDHLELHYFANNYSNLDDDLNITIRFDNVISLTVFEDKSDYKTPEKIHFPQLQQLRLNLQPEFTGTWIDFINEQLSQTINSFDLSVGILTNEHLLTIPVILPNLQSTIIRCGTDFSANEIMAFLGNGEFLQKVEMVIQMEKTQQNILRSKLQRNWKYSINPAKRRVQIMLERMNNQKDSATGLTEYSSQMLAITLTSLAIVTRI
ncbi:uncharacterized protein LOC129573863 [Sitodiplosis mosellana]|uniref:uncharacterized protein LOC129573863 n=1 Tax=Sitodiplosis mosellana TaxID=263140 RepID=UPI002444DBF9|nr:uncharacterized protein LOC129573863 [Sitodiplosis mosellana]